MFKGQSAPSVPTISTDSESDWDEESTIFVIDNGSYMIKAGFADDAKPRAIFPTVVGRQRYHGMVMVGMQRKDTFVGDEAFAKHNSWRLSVKRPVEHGIITNWDDMEKVWHHMFYNEIKTIAPEESSILISEPHNNPSYTREKTIQIMFETFCVENMYIESAASLALYSHGMTSGIVIDSGFKSTRIIPVHEGHDLPSYSTRLDIGGDDIRDYLVKISNERGYSFVNKEELMRVNDIKEKIAYVAIDFGKEMKLANEKMSEYEQNYELPDGKVLCYANERFRCTEAIFQPGLVDKECDGLCKMLHHTVIDRDLDASICDNIVLCGGNSMLHGFNERLQIDMNKLYDHKVKIVAGDDRRFSSWIGGAILSNLSTFRKQWISKFEYDEYGPTTVNYRCF